MTDWQRYRHVIHIVIGLIVSYVFMFGFHFRFFEANALYYDRLSVLALTRTFVDGGLFKNAHLGFPVEMNTLTFPFSDFSQRFILFLLSKISANLFFINNIYFLIIVFLCFLASYICIFKFTRDCFSALIGTLLFLFVPYLKVRSLEHDFLAAFYCVPIVYFLFYKIDRQKLDSSASSINAFFSNWTVMIAILILAISGIYYTVFSIGFLLFTGVLNSYLKGQMGPIRLSVYVSALTVNLLFLFALPILLEMYQLSVGSPWRPPSDQHLYGIRFSDLIWTASFYWDMTSFSEYKIMRGQYEGFDFWPGLLLSAFSIIMLFAVPPWLQKNAALSFTRSADEQRFQRLVLIFTCFPLAVLLFGGVDGIGYIFNLYIVSFFRAQNRLSPFFTFAVILVLLLILEHVRVMHIGKKLIRIRIDYLVRIALGAIFILNSFPFFGFLGDHQSDLVASSRFINDKASLTNLHAALRDQNIEHIFQSPVLAWPESAPQETFDAYDHFLPYIFSPYPGYIDWSYGLSRDQVALGLLRGLDRHPDRLWALKRISCLGFDGILIEKRAFMLDDLRKTEDAADRLSMKIVYDDELRRLYGFERLDQTSCQQNEQIGIWISTSVDDFADPYLIKGWKKAEHGVRWSGGDAVIIALPILSSDVETVVLDANTRVEFTSEKRKQIDIYYAGQKIGSWNFSKSDQNDFHQIAIPVDRELTQIQQYIELRIDSGPDAYAVHPISDDNTATQSGIGIEQIRFELVGGR